MLMNITERPRYALVSGLAWIDRTLNRKRGKAWPGYPLARRAPRSWRLHRALDRVSGFVFPEALGQP